jgi:cysteine synthase A
MLHNTILTTIGDTPLIRLGKIFPNTMEVYMKLERANPGGSIKDRVALAMIEGAEREGSLKPGTVIIEPTSGNTGIGLAMTAAVKGYKLIIVMPESMSMERRVLLKAYGAELVLTPAAEGMKGAIAKAIALHKQHPESWIPDQFVNPDNPRIHENTTAVEIIRDVPEGFAAMVTGIGTGGHISGVGKRLKQQWPDMRVVGVEPEASAVLSGNVAGPHKLQGIGAGFVPGNLQREVLDQLQPVGYDESVAQMRRLAREEGILAGISTGASLAAIRKLAGSFPKSAKILTFNYDTGERYLNSEFYAE